MSPLRAVPLLLLVVGCASDPRQVRLELLTRSSCGWSTQGYDTSCVSSLHIRLLDRQGTTARDRCTSIAGSYASLAAMVSSSDVVSLLEGVSPQQGAVIELRAYHSRDKAPCVEPTADELMLWGRSAPFDLTDEELTVVNVVLECRPECDCADLDSDPVRCPPALPVGACTPPLEVTCGKSCNESADCYGGRLACSVGTCTPENRDLCAPCVASTDCDSGLCVQNAVRQESTCADPCPAGASAAPCPELMSCKHLDDDLMALP